MNLGVAMVTVAIASAAGLYDDRSSMMSNKVASPTWATTPVVRRHVNQGVF